MSAVASCDSLQVNFPNYLEISQASITPLATTIIKAQAEEVLTPDTIMKNRKFTINKFDERLLVKLFSFLKIKDLVQVALVCKQWHRTHQHPELKNPQRFYQTSFFCFSGFCLDRATNTCRRKTLVLEYSFFSKIEDFCKANQFLIKKGKMTFIYMPQGLTLKHLLQYALDELKLTVFVDSIIHESIGNHEITRSYILAITNKIMDQTRYTNSWQKEHYLQYITYQGRELSLPTILDAFARIVVTHNTALSIQKMEIIPSFTCCSTKVSNQRVKVGGYQTNYSIQFDCLPCCEGLLACYRIPINEEFHENNFLSCSLL